MIDNKTIFIKISYQNRYIALTLQIMSLNESYEVQVIELT